MPQALSKATIGSPNTFIQSLPSALSLSKSLEGSQNNNLQAQFSKLCPVSGSIR
jgi:hypothetical protein